MPPLTIVEDLDVLEDVAPGLIAGLVVAMMDLLGLQGMEEVRWSLKTGQKAWLWI